VKKTLSVINKLKRNGIIEDYAIAGGIATIFYVEPILTYDLDIFFTYKTEPKGFNVLSPIYKFLRKKGYKEKKEHVLIEGIPVQFIPVYDALSKEGVDQAQKTTYSGVSTKVLCSEHLIAIMLQVYRPKDKERIIMLFEQAKVDKRRLNAILKRHNLSKKYKDFIKLYGL
jgi:hypothetical protein